MGHYILGCSLVEKIGSESISSACEADRRVDGAAQRSSTGSEWINWRTFNWEGWFVRLVLITLMGSYEFPYVQQKTHVVQMLLMLNWAVFWLKPKSTLFVIMANLLSQLLYYYGI